MRNDLLINDVILKERSAIHTNIDAKLLYPTIKYVQDMYILPILGTALYTKLQDLVAANTVNDTANADYKTLLETYIIDALIWYILSELPTDLTYQYWNKGVLRKQGQDTDLPSMSDMFELGERNRNKAEFYANRLRLYLIQNAPAKYLEYNQPGSGIDVVWPDQKSFTIPIYLGGDCDCDPFKTYNQPYKPPTT